MSKKISTFRNSLSFLLSTTALCIGAVLGPQILLSAQEAEPPATPKAPILGEFSLRNYRRIGYGSDSQKGVSTFSITKADLTSPRYDVAANTVSLNVKNGRARTGIATGKVHITVRDLVYDEKLKKVVSKQTINVDCDRAKYVAGEKKANGRIDFSGNIVSKTERPDFAAPLILTGQTGSVEFLGESKTNLVINNGSATVTPIEPTPAPRKP